MDRTTGAGSTRKASIKETGEELSEAEWARFEAAVEETRAERRAREPIDLRDEAWEREDRFSR